MRIWLALAMSFSVGCTAQIDGSAEPGQSAAITGTALSLTFSDLAYFHRDGIATFQSRIVSSTETARTLAVRPVFVGNEPDGETRSWSIFTNDHGPDARASVTFIQLEKDYESDTELPSIPVRFLHCGDRQTFTLVERPHEPGGYKIYLGFDHRAHTLRIQHTDGDGTYDLASCGVVEEEGPLAMVPVPGDDGVLEGSYAFDVSRY